MAYTASNLGRALRDQLKQEFEEEFMPHQDHDVLPNDSASRKAIPLTTGLLDYFPAALIEVAKVSKAGNDKHNPGEPLHHARGKSTDHADSMARHLIQRGGIDPDTGMRHSAELAWRALANLQQELEDEGLAPLPRGATAALRQRYEDALAPRREPVPVSLPGLPTASMAMARQDELDPELPPIPEDARWDSTPIGPRVDSYEEVGNDIGQARYFADGFHRRVA